MKEVTEKSAKKGPNVIVWLLILILAATIGLGGFCWYQATRNVLPEPPESFAAEDELYTTITKGIIVKGAIDFSDDELNGALEIARKAANTALAEKNIDFEITNLYGRVENSELICYLVAEKGGRSYNFTVCAEADFTSPKALIYVSEIRLGKLKLPVGWIMSKVANYPMPNNITVEGRRFVYDTSALNDLLIATARENKTISKVENAVDSILSIFGVRFELEDVIDFKITDIYIRDGKITIKSDLFKK